jgi:hypothetical protein
LRVFDNVIDVLFGVNVFRGVSLKSAVTGGTGDGEIVTGSGQQLLRLTDLLNAPARPVQTLLQVLRQYLLCNAILPQ